jgi:hypothetical protein
MPVTLCRSSHNRGFPRFGLSHPIAKKQPRRSPSERHEPVSLLKRPTIRATLTDSKRVPGDFPRCLSFIEHKLKDSWKILSTWEITHEEKGE